MRQSAVKITLQMETFQEEVEMHERNKLKNKYPLYTQSKPESMWKPADDNRGNQVYRDFKALQEDYPWRSKHQLRQSNSVVE